MPTVNDIISDTTTKRSFAGINGDGTTFVEREQIVGLPDTDGEQTYKSFEYKVSSSGKAFEKDDLPFFCLCNRVVHQQDTTLCPYCLSRFCPGCIAKGIFAPKPIADPEGKITHRICKSCFVRVHIPRAILRFLGKAAILALRPLKALHEDEQQSPAPILTQPNLTTQQGSVQ